MIFPRSVEQTLNRESRPSVPGSMDVMTVGFCWSVMFDLLAIADSVVGESKLVTWQLTSLYTGVNWPRGLYWKSSPLCRSLHLLVPCTPVLGANLELAWEVVSRAWLPPIVSCPGGLRLRLNINQMTRKEKRDMCKY